MRRSIRRLVLVCLLTAAPAVLAADDAPPNDSELRAAYCAGFHQAREVALGDVCFDAKSGWENDCSADTREESRLLAELTAEQSLYKPGVGETIVSGQNAYKQCISEIASGAAQPTCQRLRTCDD